MPLIFRLVVFSTIVTWAFHLYYGYWDGYIIIEGLPGMIIPGLVLVRHLGSKLLERHFPLWLDCVLSLIDVASATYMLALVILKFLPYLQSSGFDYTWITLCAATCLMLLSLLLNLARGLWTLYSRKTGRWTMRVQHLDNHSGAGYGFFKAPRRLSRALFGQYLLRKRFKFEKTIIRMARALSAMCLLVIFVVVAYNVLVIRPFDQRTLVPTTQYLRADPTEIFFLTKWPWIVKARLMTGTHSIQDNVRVYMTWTNIKGHVYNLTCPGHITYICPSISEDVSADAGELFVVANFTGIALAFKNGSELEKSLHGNTGPLMIRLQYGLDDMLGSSYPLLSNEFPLFPKVHIRATLAVTHIQTITNENAAALGLQEFRDWYTLNIDKLFQDPDPPISGEFFSYLRITSIPLSTSFLPGAAIIMKEVKQSSILDGAAILGGLWTFMTGMFSLVFGSSLLLVLFGIKPLSVYGVIHLLQGGRVSLAEGTPLTDEEQMRTVAILREHLMDVGDRNAEGLVNGSNEVEMIESQEGMISGRQEIDLGRESEEVNPGGIRQD